MAWTQRAQKNVTNLSITTWDGVSNGNNIYGADVAKCASGDVYGSIFPFQIRGAPPVFVQGAAATNPGSGLTSFTVTFTGKNTAGNALLLDIFWSDNTVSGGGYAYVTVTDSQGNGWAPLNLAYRGGSPLWLQKWAAISTGGSGPVTVTVTVAAPSTSFAAMALAVTEYSNLNVGLYPLLPLWTPHTLYAVGAGIQDQNGFAESVTSISGGMSTGLSGSGVPPSFSTSPGGTTGDNVLTWTNSGNILFTVTNVPFVSSAHLQLFFSVTGGTQYFMHMVVAATYGCPSNQPTAPPGGHLPVPIPTGWYIVNEPSLGFTDQSARLFRGQGAQHSGNLQSRQRGNWNYTLIVAATDAYEPTLFSPVFFYDQTPAGFTLVFAGIIQTYKHRQIATQGWRYIDCTAVSLEALLDTVMVTTPKQYVNQTCGFILTDLYNSFESGAAFSLGVIQAGATIPLFNAQVGDKLSDLATQLATTSEFTWNISPQTQQLFFGAPTATGAPFTIGSPQAMWDSITWSFDGSDYRNRQAVRLSFDAFAHSMEFFAGAGQQTFTLMRPVKQVVNAYITLSTCNSATAAFSGQPADGDTFTIGPASGVWQAGHVYALGGVIVVNGFVQKVTTAGTSGGSQPTFSTVTGQTTTDNTVIWTCQGPLGLGTNLQTYTFKTVIDNTQFGQVFIDTTVARTVQNAVDAINANAATRGVGFSLPTWENSQCNAITVTGTGFTLQQKAAGAGWIATLSKSSTNFSWSATQTSGGTSPQGSVGPNQGATITIQVYAQGTSTAAPGLAYTEGSAVINLATPLNSGTNLNVEYTRADGDVIQCERTDLVSSEAAITHGTGKFQQITDASSLGSIAVNPLSGLQLCQQALASYDLPPEEIEIEILKPGILPGQLVTLALTGALSALNGNYYAEEVRVQFVPLSGAGPTPWMDQSQAPGAGHYRYTLRLIDTVQIGSYLDWWLHSGGGGGGGGSSAGLVATSGGALGSQGNVPGAGGSNPQVQYNAAGVLAGITGATSDGTNLLVTTQAITDSSTKAASDAFVQAVVANAIAGVNPAVAVQAATVASSDTSGLTYNNGVSGVGATFTGTANTALAIDGYTFTAAGQRLLIKNDTQSPSGAFNGVYYVTQIQTLLLPPILTRALDYDQPSDINNTGAIPVINGTANASTSWVLTSQVTSVGVTPLAYTQFSINPASIVTAVTGTAPVSSSGGTTPVISVATATSGALGVVKPDGTIITVAAGAITVPKASSSTFGVVEVDGTTITASAGVISAVGVGGGAVTRIAQQILSGAAASVTFSSIPATYANLRLVILARGTASNTVDGLSLQFNGDTAANYNREFVVFGTGNASNIGSSTGSTFLPAGTVDDASNTAGLASPNEIYMIGYAQTTFFKTAMCRNMDHFPAGTTNPRLINVMGTWSSTAAINAILIFLGAGNFATGSVFTLYGES